MSDNVIELNREEENTALLPHEREFVDAIDEIDHYFKNRGELGGLETGFPQMTDKMEGLQPGLTLIAGAANMGKSALALQLARQVATQNEEAYSLFHALDDNMREVIPRIASSIYSIPINCVKFPQRYENTAEGPSILERREMAMREIKNLSRHMCIRDETYNDSGTDIETIEKSLEEILTHTDGKEVVLFIDNFHDLTTREFPRGVDDNAKYDYLADKLSTLATRYKVPVVCTAELRKLNGFRRPRIDDIRETTKIGYEAKTVMLCHNEVGLKGESASIYFTRSEIQGSFPVLEVHFGKNKVSSFKGRLFYHFYPEMSVLHEVPEEGARIYRASIIG